MDLQLTILGGGPAGLAAGYYAARRGIPFTILEAGPVPGGNCRTLHHGRFGFDTGAHRFHDKLPDITADIVDLIGDDIRRVDLQSHVYYDGKFLSFPLSPINLMARLGPPSALRAAYSFLRDRGDRQEFRSFKDFAIGTYGQYIADRFLLSYSEKLWGAPADALSVSVSGGRLKGLTLRNALFEAFFGKVTRSRHLDGSFLYPRGGIGSITDAMVDAIPPGALQLGARVTGIKSRKTRIEAIQVNGDRAIHPNIVINTLPLDIVTRFLDDAETDTLSDRPRLRYRHVLLLVLMIDRPRVTDGATVYFPDSKFPFTRVSEPKNRSRDLAPENQTSLAIEIPCFETDPIWTMETPDVAAMVTEHLAGTGLIQLDQVIGHVAHRLPRAYPVLDRQSEGITSALTARLGKYENLHTLGRNGLFAYLHVHDLMRQAKDLTAKLAAQPAL